MHPLDTASRVLWKSPGFAWMVIITLALGIGANVAIFSFFRAILLRPLPFQDPARIVLFKKTPQDYSDPMGIEIGLLTADFADLRSEAKSVTHLATYTLDAATMTGRGPADLVVAAVVTRNFFQLLGTSPFLGQTFRPEEADGAGARLAVVSHSFWKSRLGGDPTILGQSLILNKVSFTVVGVAAPDFELPRETHIWVTPAGPLPEAAIGSPGFDFRGRGTYVRTILARLAPGVALGEAERELASIVERLPNPNVLQRPVHLVTLRDHTLGAIRPALAVLLGCVGLVLLIACLNVANLMLSRATTREREVAIRLSLGASRWAVARQLLAESTLLAVLGGCAGVILSSWLLQLLLRLAPSDIPRLALVRIDGVVLAFAAVISIATGLISGLAPVLGTLRSDLVSATKQGGRAGTAGAGPRRLRALLVSGEVAVSLVLLIAAGLLFRSLQKMQDFAWGFNPAQIASARVSFLDRQYSFPNGQELFYQRLKEKLVGLPGFEAVGMSLDRIGQTWIHLPFAPETQPHANPADRPQANYHFVTPDYFRALGIGLRQGRDFTREDTFDKPPVVIIDTTIADRFFPDGNALGQRLALTGPGGDQLCEIIGIVPSVKSDGPTTRTQPDLYRAFLQVPVNNFFVHVRTHQDAASVGAMIKKAVASLDPDVPVTDIASMEHVLSMPAASRRFPLGLIATFATLAVLLAGIGIYAVTSYSVSQRTQEIGVRMALGAHPQSIARLILRQGIGPIAVGLSSGLVFAALISAGMQKLLFGIEALDLATFAAVPLLLLAIALAACLLPARRATRVDPLEALRTE